MPWPLDDAVAAYEQGDYATALRLYRRLADQGHAGAHYNLGFMYANGQGVPQNHAEAVKWYRRAADQGNARAQYNLGLMYANGQGLTQDNAEALKWYRLAADQGEASASRAAAQVILEEMDCIALMEERRLTRFRGGVKQDDVQAVKLYRLAADQGHASTQNRLRVFINSIVEHFLVCIAFAFSILLLVIFVFFVYLFVSWAGLIVTLLFIIAVFLFLLVLK